MNWPSAGQGKAEDSELVKRTSKRAAEIGELAKSYERVKVAAATLDKTPYDPEANLAVGGYKCFIKGDWDGGLPMLAHGSDQTLKTLAAKELSGAVSSDEQAKLGDGWWDMAAETQDEAKGQFQARAAFWYRKALPGLSGMSKDKVQQRLEHISGSKTELASPTMAAQETSPPPPRSAEGPVKIFTNKKTGQSFKGIVLKREETAGQWKFLVKSENGQQQWIWATQWKITSNSRRRTGFGLWPACRVQLKRCHGELVGRNVRVGKTASLQIEASGQAWACGWRRTTAVRRESVRSKL